MTVNGDTLRLPFPDASIDRIVCSEVLEHIWDYRGAIAELRTGAEAGRPHGGHDPDAVARARELGARLRVPRRARRARAHLPPARARAGPRERRPLAARLAPPHALHSPYWWIRCLGGVNQPDRRVAKRYHDFLVWQLTKNPRWLAGVDRVLNPVMGKSLVIYTQKVARDRRGRLRTGRAAADRRRDRIGAAPRRQHPLDPGGHTDRGTSSRPRWLSTSAAVTPRQRARTSGSGPCRTRTARGTRITSATR